MTYKTTITIRSSKKLTDKEIQLIEDYSCALLENNIKTYSTLREMKETAQ